MDLTNIVVCSFHTADAYYRGHAEALRSSLSRLGVQHELAEIEKGPDEEWPDICRKKIPFLAEVCERNPGKKVFWIDVDCQLLELPSFVADFSADVIGFQRGFSSPLGIGYRNRTRFWEPCFFGINNTTGGRKFIEDARSLEATANHRATDDYFFEESWRANAHRLSFQLIPSICVSSRANGAVDGLPVFFHFGDSGHVAQFKDKVVQHQQFSDGMPRPSVGERMRVGARRGAKTLERWLPNVAARRLRKVSDAIGLTQVLTGGGADALLAGAGGNLLVGSPHRRRIVEQMMTAAQQGEEDAMNRAFARLTSSTFPTAAETLAKQACDSFLHYARHREGDAVVPVAWWPRPFPGNFGDWLSPLIIAQISGHPVRYVSPTAKSSDPHIISVGSIGRFIKPRSIVVGTGISSTDIALDRNAEYVSVRGPITARLLTECGGPTIESFGDPGALLSRIMPKQRGETNGRLAFVRHFTHARIPVTLPPDVDELDVLVSHPDSIESFVDRLIQYDGVVTSAMHVMIACHSYGVPCALVVFQGFETTVHGTGVKYRDYSLGVGLKNVHEPTPISVDLPRERLWDRLVLEQISDDKLDEIESAVRRGTDMILEQLSSSVVAQ
ncbi:MAG: polysaccharide pyruvyl transferase family protein [Pirellulaceae bacterium]